MFAKQDPFTQEDKERAILLSDLRKTKCALDCIYANFDYVTDPDLIDCYIFEINAVQKLYKFLMERAGILYAETS